MFSEAVATLPGVQQKLVDKYGESENLVNSEFPSESWLKFWLLNDGLVIPVSFTHNSTIRALDINYYVLMQSGALRGHIDRGAEFMAIEYQEDPTDEQIEKLKKLSVKYSVHELRANDYSRGKISSGYIKSPDHLEYLIKYGSNLRRVMQALTGM
jgi:hypothetical protein